MSLACSAPAWLQDALRSTQITDLCLNGHNEAFADLGQGLESLCVDVRDPGWTESEFKTWLIEELSRVGKTWDARPIHRCHPAQRTPHSRNFSAPFTARNSGFPPAAAHAIASTARSIALGAIPLYSPLAEAVIRGDSVIVSGSTGSGKTTLITDLVGEIPSHERIIALEDTPGCIGPPALSELDQPPGQRGRLRRVNLRTLLKQTLRMRPDRVILGECRGPEVLELLGRSTPATKGAMATLPCQFAPRCPSSDRTPLPAFRGRHPCRRPQSRSSWRSVFNGSPGQPVTRKTDHHRAPGKWRAEREIRFSCDPW